MPDPGEEFSRYYRTLTDDELLSLAVQRQELVAAASGALEAELASRGLGAEAIHEFEEWSRAQAETEPGDTQDELPPPVELPPDWFDDTAGTPDESLASCRPKGVTVGAFVFWLSGIVGVAWGAVVVFGSAAGTTSGLLAAVVLGLFLGCFYFVTGFGLWNLKPWARTAAAALCWFNVLLLSASITGAAIIRLRGFAVDPITTLSWFVGFVWNVLWARYFGRENTRKAFRAT